MIADHTTPITVYLPEPDDVDDGVNYWFSILEVSADFTSNINAGLVKVGGHQMSVKAAQRLGLAILAAALSP